MTNPSADYPNAGSSGGDQSEGVRLQKVLSGAGVASRRAAEALIAAGRVEVDGKVVRTQGVRVNPAQAVIKVDGERITTTESGLVYMALNKPPGVVTAMSDPHGRRTVGDIVKDRRERLFHVGRLDADTEGLLLLTNDGELAHRLAHPSYEVLKTYLAEVRGPVAPGVGKQLREGIELEDGPARVDSFRVAGRSGPRVMVEIFLHEGRKHIVRRLLDAVGHPVLRLVRTQVGPVALGQLRPGNTRTLSRQEVADLYHAVDL